MIDETEIPDCCPACGSDDLTTQSTEVDIGPTNSTGTLHNAPSPRYETVDATTAECDCGWHRTVPDFNQDRERQR